MKLQLIILQICLTVVLASAVEQGTNQSSVVVCMETCGEKIVTCATGCTISSATKLEVDMPCVEGCGSNTVQCIAECFGPSPAPAPPRTSNEPSPSPLH